MPVSSHLMIFTVLVDAGLSARRLRTRMLEAGLNPDSVDAIFLTHEHGDHVKGLDVFCRNRDIQVYCSPRTSQWLKQSLREPKQWRIVEPGQQFKFRSADVATIPVQHDAAEPMAYHFRDEDASLAVISDAGYATKHVKRAIERSNTLFVEANYDEIMLQNDPKRPFSTKQRISSRYGHLSNRQAAELICEVAHSGLERVVLGHLSDDCNEPELAVEAVRDELRRSGWSGVEVICARRDAVTSTMRVAEESYRESQPVSYVQVELELF